MIEYLEIKTIIEHRKNCKEFALNLVYVSIYVFYQIYVSKLHIKLNAQIWRNYSQNLVFRKSLKFNYLTFSVNVV